MTLCARKTGDSPTSRPRRDRGRSLRDDLRDELGIVYVSSSMGELFDRVARIALSEVPVLITGESGTGKELVARAVHHLSPRAAGPFYAVNLASLSESVVESELFGHVKGAFTGATQDRDGYFVAASHSTLFLDEIGEISLTLQAKLLRAIQEREVIPVGSTRSTPATARLVAATNRDLDREIREGRFRGDLRYRLAVFPIHIPPLRERREDIPVLIDCFLRSSSAGIQRSPLTISPEATKLLCSCHWPGNVRELKNVVERLAVLADPGGMIGENDVREAILLGGGEVGDSGVIDRRNGNGPKSADYILSRHHVEVLRVEKWTRTRAAKVLGITTQTLRERLKRWRQAEWITKEEMEGPGGWSPGDRRRSRKDDPDLGVG